MHRIHELRSRALAGWLLDNPWDLFLIQFRARDKFLLRDIKRPKRATAELFLFQVWISIYGFSIFRPQVIPREYIIGVLHSKVLKDAYTLFRLANSVDIEEITGKSISYLIENRCARYDESVASRKDDAGTEGLSAAANELARLITKEPTPELVQKLQLFASEQLSHIEKICLNKASELTLAGRVRKLAASILGLAGGIILGVIWLICVLIWETIAWPIYVAWFGGIQSHGWDGQSLHGLMFMPAALGGFIFFYGISSLKDRMSSSKEWRAPSKYFGWATAMICIAFAVAYAANIAYQVRDTDLFSKLYAALFVLAGVGGPGYGAVRAAREDVSKTHSRRVW